MNKQNCFIICFLFLSFAITPLLFAEDIPGESLEARLNKIYSLYKSNSAESCRQLEEALQTSDAENLELQEAKKAYYFLANCNYTAGQLEKAVGFYKKVADLDPKDPKPLVDAASVYIHQGQYAQAHKNYSEALQKARGNVAEEKRIQAIIDNVPGKLQKNFSVSTGVGFDSNVNSGPEDTLHLLYGAFNYTLETDDKPQEDFYWENGVTAALSKAINPKSYVLFDFGANNTSYFSEKDFNSSDFSTSVGYKRLFGAKSVTVSPFVNYQTLNEDSYLITSGLNLTGAAKVSKKVNVWPNLSLYSQSYFNNDSQDAKGISLGSSASYEMNQKMSLNGSLFYTYHNAHRDQFTYDNVFVGTSISRIIAENLSAALGYNLQLFYYDDEDPIFGSSRRDQGHKFYLNFDYSLKKFFKKQDAFLSLNISHNQNDSNHSFQENSRLFAVIKLSFYF